VSSDGDRIAMADRLDAVTFDFWDTLVRTEYAGTRSARRAAVLPVLAGFGHDVDAERLDEVFDRTFAVYTEHWHDNRAFTAHQGAVLTVELLGVDLDDEQAAAVIDAFVHGAADQHLELTDHIEETLVGLKERGVLVGIICDVGLTPTTVLRGYLAGHGVLDLFDHWSFSDEVGCYKPAPEIFEHALAGLGGVAPERAAHVGDLRRTDIAGARAMGMTAVRYRGANDDPAADGDAPEGHHVIDDHADLLAALGLA
jgi:putative hydrolase of the HAD superfamily